VLSTTWLEKRKRHWTRLEELLDFAAQNGLGSLTREDLRDLGLLYRQMAADLAAIREDPTSVHVARYVNQLLTRAHNTIYAAERSRPLAALGFFRHTFPGVFRRNLACCLLALAVFAGGSLVGAVLCYRDPDFKMKILGPQMVDTIERRQMWTHSILTVKPLASSTIMTNNLSVSFTTFALGITCGLGTLYMLALNGLLLGVIGMACWLSGMSIALWSFVAPHGVLELPAIFIAGGAGLRLAQGLLFPGLLPRRDSLAEAGAEAVKLLLGCVPVLVVAGIIEGFVSPTALAVPLKFAMAGALLVLLVAYLFGGRDVGKAHGSRLTPHGIEGLTALSQTRP
jgi:uncharacterized membrane protein SpoIIM required for sporulation